MADLALKQIDNQLDGDYMPRIAHHSTVQNLQFSCSFTTLMQKHISFI